MGIEQKVEGLRAEIGKRMRDAALLREKAAACMAQDEVDKSITARARAQATDEAVEILRDRLAAHLPALVEERFAAAVPEIEEQKRKRLEVLDEEAKNAGTSFRAFFSAWNKLQCTSLGTDVATQLLGDFQPRIHNAATDRIYSIAIDRRAELRRKQIGLALERELAAVRSRIRSEVEKLNVVDAGIPERVVA